MFQNKNDNAITRILKMGPSIINYSPLHPANTIIDNIGKLGIALKKMLLTDILSIKLAPIEMGLYEF